MKISGIKKHRFVCVDTYRSRMVWVDEEGEILLELSDVKNCFDLFVLPDGRILHTQYGEGASSDGFRILNPDGSVAMLYRTEKEVFSCQPLPNGNVVVGELGPRRIVEVSPEGKVVVEIPVPYEGKPHECFRAVRKLGESYYAVQPGLNVIRRFAPDGSITREYPIHSDAFGLVMRPNGHLVYTCMSGAYELDAEGKEVWSLTDADVPEMNIRWLLGVQLLSDGNLVFANWMGHGHTDEGIQFFEVNRQKQVVWSCDGRGILLQPAVLQILDEDAATVCNQPTK